MRTRRLGRRWWIEPASRSTGLSTGGYSPRAYPTPVGARRHCGTSTPCPLSHLDQPRRCPCALSFESVSSLPVYTEDFCEDSLKKLYLRWLVGRRGDATIRAAGHGTLTSFSAAIGASPRIFTRTMFGDNSDRRQITAMGPGSRGRGLVGDRWVCELADAEGESARARRPGSVRSWQADSGPVNATVSASPGHRYRGQPR